MTPATPAPGILGAILPFRDTPPAPPSGGRTGVPPVTGTRHLRGPCIHPRHHTRFNQYASPP